MLKGIAIGIILSVLGVVGAVAVYVATHIDPFEYHLSH